MPQTINGLTPKELIAFVDIMTADDPGMRYEQELIFAATEAKKSHGKRKRCVRLENACAHEHCPFTFEMLCKLAARKDCDEVVSKSSSLQCLTEKFIHGDAEESRCALEALSAIRKRV